MNGTLQKVLKKTDADLIALLSEAEDFLKGQGASGRAILRVRLILEEMILNLLKYGAGSVNQEIGVRLEATADRIVIQIEDDGVPFDPRSAPEIDKTLPLEQRREGGMGIQIVRSFVTEMDYERIDGRNRLRMVVASI